MPPTDFWRGPFGDAYTARSQDPKLVAANLALFARALKRMDPIASVLEVGANVGLNLRALRALLPDVHVSAIEVNASAVEQLRQLPDVLVHEGSLFEVQAGCADLVLSKGVLIHVPPADLPDAYDRLALWSRRYLLLAEYYNPTPVMVPYRGEVDRLWKRDFAGEFLAQYPAFTLVDYGFVYHGDPAWPQDDLTWFLLERQ